jgi:hypothetical protein
MTRPGGTVSSAAPEHLDRLKQRKPLATDPTVPYGTRLFNAAFPGISCLATIMESLRDKLSAFL